MFPDHWINRSSESQDTAAGQHPVLARVLSSRMIPEWALQRKLALLPQPVLKGLSQAVQLLECARREQWSIVVCGDYDVDGATSTALVVRALRAMGYLHVRYAVPDRFRMGYGLSHLLIDAILGEGPVDLIITVDNGTASIEAVDYAHSLNLRVLITDHHLPGPKLPTADALVNPQQPGCPFPDKTLAGVGVAFYLMSALRSRLSGILPDSLPQAVSWLDLVALGSVADLVSLQGINRILVHHGLIRIRQKACVPGIAALTEICGRELHRLQASDLGFYLGPRLNAAGRLEHMHIGIECLLTDELEQARMLAQRLHQLNLDRRQIQDEMHAEAIDDLLGVETCGQRTQVVFQEHWHEGIVGLLASRLKEKLHVPVIALAVSQEEGILKGSARSIPGAHIRDLLAEIDAAHPGMLVRFGGHAAAAGLALRRENLAAFQQIFEDFVVRRVEQSCFDHTFAFDGVLEPDHLSLDTAFLLEDAGPWGQGCPEPRFAGTFTIRKQQLLKDRFLKMELQSGTRVISAIWFAPDLQHWPDPSVREVHALYALDINRFRSQEQLQLRIEQMYPTS